MTVYDQIQHMSKDELQKLILSIYLWGHTNEQCNVNDEVFYKHFLDLPARHIDEIVSSMDNLQLYQVCEVCNKNGTTRYLDTKFFSVDDAVHFLRKCYQFLIKVDGTTYVGGGIVHRIIAERR